MKRRMRNKERDLSTLTDQRAMLIEAAMDEGLLTREKIAKAAGISLTQLSTVFKERPEVYARFKVIRKTIVDVASDSLFEIVNNKKHPSHFQAVKFVLQTFKGDLDESLESQNSESMEIAVDAGSGHSPVLISFNKKKPEKTIEVDAEIVDEEE